MNPTAILIEEIYSTIHGRMLSLIKRRIGCEETAEELVQEAYLRVMQLDAIDEIDNLAGFLYRVAVNLAKDHRRQPSVAARDRSEQLDEGLVCPRPTPDTIVQAQQELDKLSLMIAELPTQCRQIFLLHKVQHLSHAEIGVQLNISPRTVEAQICKALRILRDRMSR